LREKLMRIMFVLRVHVFCPSVIQQRPIGTWNELCSFEYLIYLWLTTTSKLSKNVQTLIKLENWEGQIRILLLKLWSTFWFWTWIYEIQKIYEIFLTPSPSLIIETLEYRWSLSNYLAWWAKDAFEPVLMLVDLLQHCLTSNGSSSSPLLENDKKCAKFMFFEKRWDTFFFLSLKYCHSFANHLYSTQPKTDKKVTAQDPHMWNLGRKYITLLFALFPPLSLWLVVGCYSFNCSSSTAGKYLALSIAQ